MLSLAPNWTAGLPWLCGPIAAFALFGYLLRDSLLNARACWAERVPRWRMRLVRGRALRDVLSLISLMLLTAHLIAAPLLQHLLSTPSRIDLRNWLVEGSIAVLVVARTSEAWGVCQVRRRHRGGAEAEASRRLRSDPRR